MTGIPTTSPGTIILSQVSKVLRGRRVLSDVGFELDRGEIGVIEGTNGAGKTTLLRIASTVVSPDSGFVTVNGFDSRTEGRKIRRSIGVAFVNDRSLYWRMDAKSNLRIFGRLAGLSGSEISNRTESLISELKLTDAAGERVGRMSTGQRQRVLIARALLTGPEVLLLDEPLRGLDSQGVEVVLELLKSRSRAGVTVLMVAPLLQELQGVADQLFRLSAGELQGVAAP